MENVSARDGRVDYKYSAHFPRGAANAGPLALNKSESLLGVISNVYHFKADNLD
jgi:hypothetical protein